MIHALASRWRDLWTLLIGAPSRRDPLGDRGERATARFLARHKYRVLARNVRVRFGEADILCLAPDRRTIVVVEVKTRRVDPAAGRPFAAPELSITDEKRRKLRAVLQHLARANRWHDRDLRIDAIAVEWRDDAPPAIRHHQGLIRITRRRQHAPAGE